MCVTFVENEMSDTQAFDWFWGYNWNVWDEHLIFEQKFKYRKTELIF